MRPLAICVLVASLVAALLPVGLLCAEAALVDADKIRACMDEAELGLAKIDIPEYVEKLSIVAADPELPSGPDDTPLNDMFAMGPQKAVDQQCAQFVDQVKIVQSSTACKDELMEAVQQNYLKPSGANLYLVFHKYNSRVKACKLLRAEQELDRLQDAGIFA